MSFIGLVAIVVEEYDPAIEFFVDVLGFELVEDSPSLTNDGRPKRWVVVRPPGAETGILLARADGDDQSAAIGKQTAGRVGFFLRVDDFDAHVRTDGGRRMSSSSRCRAPSRTVEWPCSSTSPAIAGTCSVLADASRNRASGDRAPGR